MGRSGVGVREAGLALLLAACTGEPGLSPAGDSVLLVSDRGGAQRIYEVGLTDGAARPVGSPETAERTYLDAMPARLPDGRITFVSNRDGAARIYLASTGEGAVTRLTPDLPGPPAAESDPAPLGRDRILFARTEPGAAAGSARDLFIVRLDGSGLRRLTRHPADDSEPAGSPDGHAVAFVSERAGARRVWLIPEVDAADPEATVIDLSGAGKGSTFADGAPTFLPDGTILFSRARAGGVPHLFHMGRAGARGGLRQITDSLSLRFGADEPVLLPDRTILLVTGPIPPPEGVAAPARHLVYRIDPGGFNLSRVSRERAQYSDFSRGLSAFR